MSDLSRRAFGHTAVAGLGSSLLAEGGGSQQRAERPRKPNIVFLCSDQHDGRAMGCSGHPIIRTPNLDRLASMGVLFRNAYCGSPVCCPSRAGMATGMFPSDVGSYCNATCFDGRFPTWGKRLRDVGYRCWAAGKLDLAPEHDLGFEQVDTEHGNFIEPDITSLFRRPMCFRVNTRDEIGTIRRKKPHPDAKRIQTARRFLATEAREHTGPLVTYVGLEQPKSFGSGGLEEYLKLYPFDEVPLPNIPPGHLETMHTAFQVLRNFQMFSTAMSKDRVRRARAAYWARVSETDAYVGEILDQLEENGELEDTLIVYTSDHGEMNGEHGLWAKNCLLEASARIPMIIAGAGLPKGTIVDRPVAHVDLVATLLDVAGADKPDELRGHSLLALAHGESGQHPGFAVSEAHSSGNYTGGFMVRKGDWKYLYFSWDDNLLFNLKNDPDELHNLAGKPETSSIERELHEQLTSLLDPDSVTKQAFAEQERRLAKLVRSNSEQEFYQILVSRLGKGQAAALTDKYY